MANANDWKGEGERYITKLIWTGVLTEPWILTP
jgi:hypothetical protein